MCKIVYKVVELNNLNLELVYVDQRGQAQKAD